MQVTRTREVSADIYLIFAQSDFMGQKVRSICDFGLLRSTRVFCLGKATSTPFWCLISYRGGDIFKGGSSWYG